MGTKPPKNCATISLIISVRSLVPAYLFDSYAVGSLIEAKVENIITEQSVQATTTAMQLTQVQNVIVLLKPVQFWQYMVQRLP